MDVQASIARHSYKKVHILAYFGVFTNDYILRK